MSGASGLGDYRWRGYSLAEKQQWMREGKGSGAVGPGLDILGSLTSAYGESHQRPRGVLGELGVSWSGPAAEAAAASLGQTMDRAAHLTATISANGAGLGRYADSFDQLRVRIPAPIEVRAGWRVPGEPSGDLTVLGGLQSDPRAEQLAYQRADQEANAALEAHERSTRAMLDSWAAPAASEAGGTGPVVFGADRSPPDNGTGSLAARSEGAPRAGELFHPIEAPAVPPYGQTPPGVPGTGPPAVPALPVTTPSPGRPGPAAGAATSAANVTQAPSPRRAPDDASDNGSPDPGRSDSRRQDGAELGAAAGVAGAAACAGAMPITPVASAGPSNSRWTTSYPAGFPDEEHSSFGPAARQACDIPRGGVLGADPDSPPRARDGSAEQGAADEWVELPPRGPAASGPMPAESVGPESVPAGPWSDVEAGAAPAGPAADQTFMPLGAEYPPTPGQQPRSTVDFGDRFAQVLTEEVPPVLGSRALSELGLMPEGRKEEQE